MTNESDGPEPLNYAAPEPRALPAWAHGVAIVFWGSVLLIVYSMAIAVPLMVILAIVLTVHPMEHMKAFGEPIITTWQRIRFVLYPVALSTVFIPLAIWFHRQRTPNP